MIPRLFAALLLLLAACSSDGRKEDTKALKNQVFEDVPAPDGFNYTEGNGYRNERFRSYKQVYHGERKVSEVLAFYREKMSFHEWTLKNEEGAAPETVKLTFAKAEEKCVVQVETDTRSRKTVVTVTLSYKD